MATAEHTYEADGSPIILEMAGKYAVASGTTAIDIENDVGCWLESAQSTIDMVIDGMSDDGGQIAANPRMVARALHGVLLQLRMVEAGIVAAACLRAREKQ
jgi:hypothetical protein